MNSRARLAVAAIVALPLGLGAGLATAADTTLGADFAPASNCGAGVTFMQALSGGASYAVPANGVITSVRIRSSASGVARAFKLVRQTGPGNYLIVGESALGQTDSSGVLDQTTRIPARQGDFLGVYVGADGTCAIKTTGAGDDERAAFTNGNPSVGTTLTDNSGEGYRLAVRANLEPDADGDGYGDTTQDACPTDASTAGSCPGPLPAQLAVGPLGPPVGKARVGKRLSAPPVTVPAGASESFQWFRIAKKPKHHRTVTKPIGGATGAAYKTKKKDRGAKVFVRITLTGSNFIPATADSPARRIR